MKITKDSKVYIAGCGGMLGEAVYEYFSPRSNVLASDIDQNTDWLQYGDVRDYAQINESITAFDPDLIINLAALTDLEVCENDPDNAWATNALGAENVALIASNLDVPLVYICTAGIVDGKQDVYNDFDAPNPLSIYAKAKYHGEMFVQRQVRQHFIFRAGWMMGGGPQKDKKFINKIFKQLQAGQKELFVVDDKLGTPTYTVSFARGIFKVVESGLFGLYNQVCGGDSSRYDVALEFVRLLGLEDEIKVTKVSSDHFKTEYFAPRPPSEKLVNFKLNARKINFMPDWHEALSDYVERFK